MTEVVQEQLADKPLAIREAVATYLAQIPATIRRSLRRPSDSSGTTVPPDLIPTNAQSLLRFLPAKLPRFKAGDQPLPGVDWQLELLLGVGGFGEVWKARNPQLSSSQPVALKFCTDPLAAKMLRNEATMLDRIMQEGKHPGIIQLQHTYLSAETPCLQYELVEGSDLAGRAPVGWPGLRVLPQPRRTAGDIILFGGLRRHGLLGKTQPASDGQ